MPGVTDNKETANLSAGTAAANAPSPQSTAGPQPIPPAEGTQALAVLGSGLDESLSGDETRDARLDHLPMQVDVLVKVRAFRVQDLLSMEKGTVVETVHEHTQDVPLHSGGALLMWSEFEVLDQRLAVRVTRLG
jgi:flagellar motor switch protein FliN